MFKKIMLAGLMAATALSASAPAYAQRGDGHEWRGEGRGQGGGDTRGQGNWRGQGGEARQGGWQQRQQPQTPAAQPDYRQRAQETPVRQAPQVQPRGDWRGNNQDWRNNQNGRADNRDWRNGQNGRVDNRDWRNGQNGRVDNRDWRNGQNGRADNHDWRNDRNGGLAGHDWRNNRQDDRRGNDWRNDNRRFDNRTRWSNQRQWNSGWRNDRRYDWRGYRNNYGDRFNFGSYYAPRGWNYGYRSLSVGVYLDSLLFSQNYWLNDPYQYRLPPAYGTLRWVRYYDDALLVDIRDGYVVDVINDFFD